MAIHACGKQKTNVSLKVYVREKIRVLKELGIDVTDSQIDHMMSLKSELHIDNYAHDLIMKRK